MFWIACLRVAHPELARWAVSAIFEKWPSVIFNHIFLLLDTRKSCVFQIFLIRSIKAYLCPTIIDIDCVDFSEGCPEEVISFFWRSVYVLLFKCILLIPTKKCTEITIFCIREVKMCFCCELQWLRHACNSRKQTAVRTFSIRYNASLHFNIFLCYTSMIISALHCKQICSVLILQNAIIIFLLSCCVL